MKQMEKRWLKVIVSCIMCILCTFSFVGCFRNIVPLDQAGNRPSGGVSGGGKQEEPEKSSTPYISNIGDVMQCAIGVYELDKTQDEFYDKYVEKKVSFEYLVNRQFLTFNNYIIKALSYVYGEETEQSGQILPSDAQYGFNKALELTYLDSLAGEELEEYRSVITNDTPGDDETNTFFYFKNAVSGGYSFELNINKDNTKKAYYGSELTDVWNSNENLNGCIESIMYNLLDVGDETIDDLRFDNSDLIKKYTNYTPKSISLDNITTVGLTDQLLVNIAYYLRYTVIGDELYKKSTNTSDILYNGKLDIEGKNIKVDDPNITDEQLTQKTQAWVKAYQAYKGYEVIIPAILKNARNLSIGSGGNLTFKTDNADTTPFPKVKAELYLYFEDPNNVADSFDPNPPYNPDDADDESKSLPLIKGRARQLKEIIFIPKINPEGVVTQEYIGDGKMKDVTVKITSFQIKYLLFGMQSEGDDFKVRINYEYCYDNGQKSPEGSVTKFTTMPKRESDEETPNYKEDAIIYTEALIKDSFDNEEDVCDGSFYEKAETEEGKEKIKDCIFKDARFTGKSAEETLSIIEASFEIYEDEIENTGVKMNIGSLKSYNNLFDNNLELNFEANYLKYIFTYFDTSGNILEEIPLAYLMEFTISN